MAGHVYGGPHTDRDKLRRLQAYLRAYSTALKQSGFVLAYIDAFAGSGDRDVVQAAFPLLGDGETVERVVTVPGSARIAIDTDPPLHRLILIEKDRRRFAELLQIKAQHPNRCIECRQGDANDIVQEICSTLPWRGPAAPGKGMRAVMFLDPYGMQVGWETLRAIARTEAVDLWYFFPLMGVYRQAARDLAAVDPDKRRALTFLLGTEEWMTAWYPPAASHQASLFDPDESATQFRTANVDALEQFALERLRTIFRGGVLPPVRIYLAGGAPLASLFFAVSNPHPRASQLAKRIADHILG